MADPSPTADRDDSNVYPLDKQPSDGQPPHDGKATRGLLSLAGTRLADRTRWPRKWWRPLSEKIELTDEELKRQHDEVSKAIDKLLLALIGFSVFCELALGAPDRSLLASDAQIQLPFANNSISFVAFLIIGPLVLIAFSFYLHIFVGYWIALSRQVQSNLSRPGLGSTNRGLPFVFNLQGRTAAWLSSFLIYWLVTIVLASFAWKALPRTDESPILIILTGGSALASLLLRMRRHPDRAHEFALLTALLLVTYITLLAAVRVRQSEWGRQLLLWKADLSKRDLARVNLHWANLEGANLGEANLAGATLIRANLAEANLERANLAGANLGGATLVRALLERANLERTDLGEANLAGANLTDTIYLTQGQVDSAWGNAKTKLPPGLVMPQSWKPANQRLGSDPGHGLK